eukprot:6209065-Pleurochrysis_carterae.AAC.6
MLGEVTGPATARTSSPGSNAGLPRWGQLAQRKASPRAQLPHADFTTGASCSHAHTHAPKSKHSQLRVGISLASNADKVAAGCKQASL